MNYFLAYLSTLLPMLALDALWLGLVAKNFYREHLGFLFGDTMKFGPAALFYPLYAAAILFLAVLPAVNSGAWTGALWRGALLGLAAYAAYDLTNHATIANWPVVITVADIAWGVFVTAAASVAAYFIITVLEI